MKNLFLLLLSICFVQCSTKKEITGLPNDVESVNVQIHVMEDDMRYKGEINRPSGSGTTVELTRVNNSEVSKTEKQEFKKLISKGVPLTVLQYTEQTAPEQLKAFGYEFAKKQTENHRILYETEQKDHMVQQLLVDFSIMNVPRQHIKSITYNKLYPRSNRMRTIEVWHFYGYQ